MLDVRFNSDRPVSSQACYLPSMWSLNLSLSPLEGRNDNATYFARITISSRNMYSAQHSVYMFLTFFICQNNTLKKKKINYFLHITIKQTFSLNSSIISLEYV